MGDGITFVIILYLAIAVIGISIAYFIWFIKTFNSVKNDMLKTRLQIEEIRKTLDDYVYENEDEDNAE